MLKATVSLLYSWRFRFTLTNWSLLYNSSQLQTSFKRGLATQYASAPCKLTISSHLFPRWHLFRQVGYLRHQQQVDLWPFDLDRQNHRLMPPPYGGGGIMNRSAWLRLADWRAVLRYRNLNDLCYASPLIGGAIKRCFCLSVQSVCRVHRA